MAATTTICIDPKVKDILTSLKRYPRESYNSVVERLANLAIDEEPLSDEAIHGIEEALEDIKHGRLHSEEEIMNMDFHPHN
jgi:predicted transcriptional regulator